MAADLEPSPAGASQLGRGRRDVVAEQPASVLSGRTLADVIASSPGIETAVSGNQPSARR